MKKIAIFSILAVFISAFVIGCGSDTRLDPIKVSPYSFINASTPLDIREGGSDYNLSVQLIENGFGYEGQAIRMAPFDVKYGIVDPGEVETNADGWAVFDYRAPEDLHTVSGQSITLTAIYDDGNGSILSQNFVLNFASVPEGNLYHLTNQSTPIVVRIDTNDTNNTTGTGPITKQISAYVVDNDNIGVEGKTVTIGILDQQFGSISPSSTQTDAAGKATFTYTTSDDIDLQIGKSTVVNINYTENGVTESLPVTIMVTACCGCPGGPSICP